VRSLELVEANYFIKEFPSSWEWLLSRISKRNKSHNLPLVRNVQQLFGLIFFEISYPTLSYSHSPSSNDHVLQGDCGANDRPFSSANVPTSCVGASHDDKCRIFDMPVKHTFRQLLLDLMISQDNEVPWVSIHCRWSASTCLKNLMQHFLRDILLLLASDASTTKYNINQRHKPHQDLCMLLVLDMRSCLVIWVQQICTRTNK
jgi:hypothetical protein